MNKLASGQKTSPKNEAIGSDSITNVHFSEGVVPEYVSRVREPIAIRIDTGVYKRFKPVAKRV